MHSESAELPTSSARRRSAADAARIGVRPLLFLVLGATAVAPVGMLGLDQAERWAASELGATDRQTLAAARAAADQLSIAMLAYVQAAQTFSDQIGNTGRFDRESLVAAMGAHMRNHPAFFGAYIADASGRSLVHLKDGAFVDGGINYADRDYYKEIVATGRAVISGVHIGRVTGALTVQVAAPIKDSNGTLLGITCSSVDLGSITGQAKETVRGMAEGRVMVVDGDGQRLADSAGPPQLAPEDIADRPLFARPRTDEPELRAGEDDFGREVRGYAVSLKAPVASWRVLALRPKQAIDAHARRLVRQTAALVVGLGVLALAVAAAIAAWLARPLRALAFSAQAVTRGAFDLLPEVPRNAPREMAQLTRAVRTMIERLRGHAQDLERQVAARTAELSRANADISGALETIRRHEQARDADLEKARLFQAKLLPQLPRREDVTLAAHYEPLDQVGGDIYDVLRLDNGDLRLFLADATGHGVQASLRTLMLKSAYDRLRTRIDCPSALLTELNAQLVSAFPDGDLHCTACCVDVRLGPHGTSVTYANAGSAPLYALSSEAAALELYTDGPLFGVEFVSWPAPLRFELEPGQVLVVASDGLIEQSNPERQRFESRLAHLQLSAGVDANAALAQILEAFHAFRGGEEIRDDLTVLIVAPARSP